MKRLLVILGAVSILGVLAFGALIYSANILIERFKPELEGQLSGIVGSPVKLGALKVTVLPSGMVSVRELTLGDRKMEGDTLALKNLDLAFDLLPLLSRRIQISSLVLDGPNVTLVKDADGVRVLGLGSKRDKRAGGPAPQHPAPKLPKPEPQQNLSFNLRTLAVRNGSFTFVDEVAKQRHEFNEVSLDSSVAMREDSITAPTIGLKATLKDGPSITLDGRGFTRTEASGKIVLASLAAELLGNTITVKDVAFDPATNQGAMKIRSEKIALESLGPLMKRFSPDFEKFGLKGTIEPDISVELAEKPVYKAKGTIKATGIYADPAATGGQKIENASATFALDADSDRQKITSENVTLTLNAAPLAIVLDAEHAGAYLRANKLAINGFGGTISAPTTLQTGTASSFTSKGAATTLGIPDLLKAFVPAKADLLTGVITNLTYSLTGAPGPTLTQSLQGPVSIAIKNGELKGVNIGKEVIGEVGTVVTAAGVKISPRFEPFMQKNATAIHALNAGGTLGGGVLKLDTMKMESDFFIIEGAGTISLEGALDLDTTISFTPEFSAALVGSVKELKAGLSNDGRLIMPLKLEGKAPKLSIRPDLKKLLTDGAKNAIRDQASKAIDKHLSDKIGAPAADALKELFKF